jgi:phage terminase small subunit
VRASQLTARQERFVDEYMRDLNATQAAVRAGYSAKNADKIGHQLLGKSRVSAAVQQHKKERAARAALKAEDVLAELALIATSDIGEVMDFSGPTLRLRPLNEIPDHARRASAAVKVKRYVERHGKKERDVEITEVRLWPKLPALELYGRHLGVGMPTAVDWRSSRLAAYIGEDRTPKMNLEQVRACLTWADRNGGSENGGSEPR